MEIPLSVFEVVLVHTAVDSMVQELADVLLADGMTPALRRDAEHMLSQFRALQGRLPKPPGDPGRSRGFPGPVGAC